MNFKLQKNNSVMKIVVSLLPLVFGGKGPCRVGSETRQVCQNICDATTHCHAWSYNDSLKTCWMKQRYNWVATPDNDFVSGFKGQGPFYQQKTNLVGGDELCEIGQECRINTANNEECQAVCELTDYCYGWSRGKSGLMDGMCQFKALTGWQMVQNDIYDSATKSTGVLQPNTHLYAPGGVGNYICDQVTPCYEKLPQLAADEELN